MRRYIIVTGIPGSGKTTIGNRVARELGLEMLDKDEILESMFHNEGIGNAEWRTRLSRAADEVLKEKAFQANSAVIASWWRHPASLIDSGTPIDWLGSLPGVLTEIHCICRPHIAAERFLSRKRHEGHLDHSKSYSNLLVSFEEQALRGSLAIGPVIKVDTEKHVDMFGIIDKLDIAAHTSISRS